LLVVTIILEIFRKEKYFTFALLIASFGFAISLPIVNVDKFIVEQNIQHGIDLSEDASYTSREGDVLDEQYFIELSDDAVPALVTAFKDERVSEEFREQIGASLACIRYDREHDEQEEYPWQSFHFSRVNADAALQSIDKDLNAYPITKGDWSASVTTPSDEEFQCETYYYD
jgi:hypothetical protein